jgi:DNA-binding FadR family transcriptional regulator
VHAPRASELIAGALRRDIVMHRLGPGDQLPPEHELMATFGVSRPTLREALRILESESLVTVVRGAKGGPQVARPDIAVVVSYAGYLLQSRHTALHDVFRAREVIETAAVRELATASDGVVPAALAAALDSEQRHLTDALQFQRCATAFHDALVIPGMNPAWSLAYLVVRDIGDRHSRMATEAAMDEPRLAEHFRRTHQVHGRVADLIATGEAAAATALWTRHMESTWRGMRSLGLATAIDVYG